MQTPNNLSQEQAEALHALSRTLTSGQTVYLNPANPAHKAGMEIMLSAGKKTSEQYPHLHAMMGKAATNARTLSNGQNQDRVQLVDAGRTASGKATATVWARSSGNTLINCGNIMVFDADSGKLLAQGSNSAVRTGLLECPVHSDTALPAGKRLSILYTGHVTEDDGSTRAFAYTNTVSAGGGEEAAIQATVTQPISKQNASVWIAVGRDAAHPPPSNTDYIYVEPNNQNESNPYLISPFVGSVPLSGSVDVAAITINDIETSIYVNNGSGGTNEIGRYSSDSKMLAGLSVGSAPNILAWNYPYDGKDYKTTASIVYNQSTLGDEIDSYFYFGFLSIPFTDGSTSPPFYVCSTGLDEESSINCTKIQNLYYWWHCLAKGTLVTLENGLQKPIEEINEHYRVRSNDGKSYAVTATVLGRHASGTNGKGIYRLTTANGKTITTTPCHVVFISNTECRMVSHLAPGDPILTDEGMSTVKTIAPVDGEEMFYGLALGNPTEQASPGFPVNRVGYFGNGILSGDQLTMRATVLSTHHDLDFMLPRIKPELRTDYASAVKQKRS